MIAYRSLGTWRADGAFGAWLSRIAVRLAIRRASSRKQVTWLDPLAAEADQPGQDRFRTMSVSDAVDPAHTLLRSERDAQIRAAVASLDEPYREVVALRFFAERSLAGDRRRHGPAPGHREDPSPPGPGAPPPQPRGGRPMTAPRPGDRARPVRPRRAGRRRPGSRPDELAAETRLARDLEERRGRGGVAPSAGFADRVMAAVATEPVPAPAIAAGSALRRGAVLGFLIVDPRRVPGRLRRGLPGRGARPGAGPRARRGGRGQRWRAGHGRGAGRCSTRTSRRRPSSAVPTPHRRADAVAGSDHGRPEPGVDGPSPTPIGTPGAVGDHRERIRGARGHGGARRRRAARRRIAARSTDAEPHRSARGDAQANAPADAVARGDGRPRRRPTTRRSRRRRPNPSASPDALTRLTATAPGLAESRAAPRAQRARGRLAPMIVVVGIPSWRTAEPAGPAGRACEIALAAAARRRPTWSWSAGRVTTVSGTAWSSRSPAAGRRSRRRAPRSRATDAASSRHRRRWSAPAPAGRGRHRPGRRDPVRGA